MNISTAEPNYLITFRLPSVTPLACLPCLVSAAPAGQLLP